jgi:hypothetical protein
MTVEQSILNQEKIALETDKALYLDCMNGRPFSERVTEQDIRDGLLLFWHVYTTIKNG